MCNTTTGHSYLLLFLLSSPLLFFSFFSSLSFLLFLFFSFFSSLSFLLRLPFFFSSKPQYLFEILCACSDLLPHQRLTSFFVRVHSLLSLSCVVGGVCGVF